MSVRCTVDIHLLLSVIQSSGRSSSEGHVGYFICSAREAAWDLRDEVTEQLPADISCIQYNGRRSQNVCISYRLTVDRAEKRQHGRLIFVTKILLYRIHNFCTEKQKSREFDMCSTLHYCVCWPWTAYWKRHIRLQWSLPIIEPQGS